MVRYKYVGGGPGDDEQPPPRSGKAVMQDEPAPKKHKRLSRKVQQLMAIAEAADRAERGGRHGSLRIDPPDPDHVARALQTPLEILEPILREGIQKIWVPVPKPLAHKETPLSAFFDVKIMT